MEPLGRHGVLGIWIANCFQGQCIELMVVGFEMQITRRLGPMR